jgi:hypothetical protein
VLAPGAMIIYAVNKILNAYEGYPILHHILYVYFSAWLAIGLLVNYVTLALSLYLLRRLPRATLQDWLEKAALCADEGIMVYPAPPPPDPDEEFGSVTRFWRFYLQVSGFALLVFERMAAVWAHCCIWRPLRRLMLFPVERMIFMLLVLLQRTHRRFGRQISALYCLFLLLASPTVTASKSLLTSSLNVDAIAIMSKQTDPADLGAAIFEAFKRLMDDDKTKRASTKPKPQEQGVILASGMGFRTRGDRTSNELAKGFVIVSRDDRSTLSAEALKKLRDRVCVALPHKLSEPKWSDILDQSTDTDLGSTIISTQTQIQGVVEFAQSYDIAYVCNIPLVKDMFDEVELSQCTYRNLLTHYNVIHIDQVRDYQSMINLRGFDVDRESDNWLMTVLEKSTEDTLLVRLKQSLLALHPSQRGGVMMFKLVVDTIAKPSFEFIQAGVNWVDAFKLSNFSGEHVPTATTRFKAVIGALPPTSVPPTTVDKYLNGMTFCSNDEFKQTVLSIRGSLYNPLLDITATYTIPAQLDMFGSALEQKFTALTTIGQWTGAHHKASAFKALQNKQHKYPSREAWFDAQVCGECGENDPTWAHDDPVGKRSKNSAPKKLSKSSSRPASVSFQV